MLGSNSSSLTSEANRAGVYSPPFFSRLLYALHPYIYSIMKKFIFIFCLADNTPIGYQYCELASLSLAHQKKDLFMQYGFVPTGGECYFVCVDPGVIITR